MPRKGWVLRRKIPGDAVYGSDLVQKFISSMMYDGKRSTAQTIFYKAMEQVAQEDQRRCAEDFQEGRGELQAGAGSEDAARGRRELSSAGGSESVSQAVAGDSLAGAVRAARAAGKSMTNKLAEELMDAANGRGGAVKKKEDVHRMAEANKAFAHYRW